MKTTDAYQRFAEMMCERIEAASEDWQQPWFTFSNIKPQNINGQEYHSLSNQMMLMMHTQKQGYKFPVFCTFSQINAFNDGVDDEHRTFVNKGESSFPVFTSIKRYKNEEDADAPLLNEDQYNDLSEDEQEDYRMIWIHRVFNVFNIDQTNIRETHPEIYSRYENLPDTQGDPFIAIDVILAKNDWICPVTTTEKTPNYNVATDTVSIVEPKYFKYLDDYYSTVLHEFAHSTGRKDTLSRFFDKDGKRVDTDYAKEELIAELTASYVACYFGMERRMIDESAKYCKEWLQKLKSQPSYIKSLLIDMERASRVLINKIEEYEDYYCFDIAV